MSAYYFQPAAANYNTPPGFTHTPRGIRVCDFCNAVENPSGPRLQLCSRCLVTQYCSQHCQGRHWQSHKLVCRQLANQREMAGNVGKDLRKFASDHTALLGWAGYQALQPQRVPSNIRQKALLIELKPLERRERHRLFSIASIGVVPRSYVSDHALAEDIGRRDERCRQHGGVGTLLVILQSCGVSEVVPVEMAPPSEILWDIREDWQSVLRHFVDSGRTDFQPISTTSKGIVYG